MTKMDLFIKCLEIAARSKPLDTNARARKLYLEITGLEYVCQYRNQLP